MVYSRGGTSFVKPLVPSLWLLKFCQDTFYVVCPIAFIKGKSLCTRERMLNYQGCFLEDFIDRDKNIYMYKYILPQHPKNLML